MQAATARIAELEAELAEMKDRWMRAEAETANVRARAQREVDETRQYAVQKFAQRRGRGGREPQPRPRQPAAARRRASRRSSPACARASTASSATSSAMLERNGIKREDPTGAPFDPNLHQAMAEQESAAHPPGTRDAGLDAGLDAERPAAAPGHGGGGQGAARRDHVGARAARQLDTTA